MLKVMDGARPVRRFRRRLERRGLEFRYTGQGASRGYYCTEDTSKARMLVRFCADHGLKYRNTEDRYSRSENYRKTFFAHNAGWRGDGYHYHCAYCGRRLRPETLEVDHIIPVHAAESSFLTRRVVDLLCLSSINDPRNLTASCHRCNHKKGSKTGLWVLRGFVGRHHFFWAVIHFIQFALFLLALWYLAQSGMLADIFQCTVQTFQKMLQFFA